MDCMKGVAILAEGVDAVDALVTGTTRPARGDVFGDLPAAEMVAVDGRAGNARLLLMGRGEGVGLRGLSSCWPVLWRCSSGCWP